MSDEAKLVVSLQAKIDAFQRNMEKASGTAEKHFRIIEKRAKEAGERMSENMKASAEGINRTLEAIGIGLGLKEVAEMADAYANFAARFTQAMGGADAGKETMEALAEAANRTRASIDDTNEAFLRDHQIMTDLGYSTATQVKVQEALNAGLRLSGSTGERATAVMEAFTTAISTGAITGKQLNVFFENGGRLVQALAQHIGVSTAALKTMAKEGKVTSLQLINAFKDADEGLVKELDTLPQSFGDSMTKIKNALGEFVGKSSASTTAAKAFAVAADFVAKNVDAITLAAAGAAAILGVAFVASNPFVAMAVAIVAASAALEEFGNYALKAEGHVAGIGDVAGVVWNDISSGVQTAASAIETAFSNVASVISEALGGGKVAMSDLTDFMAHEIDGIINSFRFLADVVKITFKGVVPAIADGVISAANFMVAKVTEALNVVVDKINGVLAGFNAVSGLAGGPQIPKVSRLSAPQLPNAYAGAGGKLAGDIGGAAKADFGEHPVEDAVKTVLNQADAIAKARDAKGGPHLEGVDHPHSNAPEGHGGGRGRHHGGEGEHGAKNFEKELQAEKGKIDTLNAETNARRNATGSLEEQEAAAKRAETVQRLLNDAQKDGVKVTPQLRDRINALADAYGKAELDAKNLAKSQEEAKHFSDELASSGEDAFKGFVDGIAKGQTAMQALTGALSKLGSKLLDLGLDSLMKGLTSSAGGGGAGGGIASLASFLPHLFGFSEGGFVNGVGGPTSDSNLAALSHGEFVVNADAASKHGDLLQAINGGRAPGLSHGGVSTSRLSSNYAPTVNVTMHGGSEDVAKQVAKEVGKHLQPPRDGFRLTPTQRAAANHAFHARAARQNS